MSAPKSVSDLEAINPAFSAKVILTLYKVLFAFMFLIFTLGPIVGLGLVNGGAGVLGGFVIALPATLILSLWYNHLTRVAIASLMTWHFARENALASREILSVLRRGGNGANPQGPHAPNPSPNPNAPISTPKAHAPKMRIVKPKPAHDPEPSQEDASIVTACPSCGARFRAKASMSGKTMPCPKCGNEFTVSAE